MDLDLEAKLLEQARKSGNNDSAIKELIDFYMKESVPEKAVAYLVKKISNTEDVEKTAYFCLEMGAEMEKSDVYERAILFYSYGLSLTPKTVDIMYFLNNNIGYSFNMLGRHAEAEAHCEVAIQMNPSRHNAYKNLAISLQGQGRYVEAAENYMQAVRTCPADPRALIHLQDLLSEHPEVAFEVEDVEEFMSKYSDNRVKQLLH